MNCPKCNSETIRTIMTRQYRMHAVIRRRKCADCGHGWYTMESQIPDDSIRHSRTYSGKSTFSLHKDFLDIAYQVPTVIS